MSGGPTESANSKTQERDADAPERKPFRLSYASHQSNLYEGWLPCQSFDETKRAERAARSKRIAIRTHLDIRHPNTVSMHADILFGGAKDYASSEACPGKQDAVDNTPGVWRAAGDEDIDRQHCADAVCLYELRCTPQSKALINQREVGY
jgi:hypothetical protein